MTPATHRGRCFTSSQQREIENQGTQKGYKEPTKECIIQNEAMAGRRTREVDGVWGQGTDLCKLMKDVPEACFGFKHTRLREPEASAQQHHYRTRWRNKAKPCCLLPAPHPPRPCRGRGWQQAQAGEGWPLSPEAAQRLWSYTGPDTSPTQGRAFSTGRWRVRPGTSLHYTQGLGQVGPQRIEDSGKPR